MSLAPDEQETLAVIETQLRKSDPRLAAKFAIFAHQVFRRKGPVRELVTPWRVAARRRIRHTMITIVILLSLLGVVIGLLLAASSSAAHVYP